MLSTAVALGSVTIAATSSPPGTSCKATETAFARGPETWPVRAERGS